MARVWPITAAQRSALSQRKFTKWMNPCISAGDTNGATAAGVRPNPVRLDGGGTDCRRVEAGALACIVGRLEGGTRLLQEFQFFRRAFAVQNRVPMRETPPAFDDVAMSDGELDVVLYASLQRVGGFARQTLE